MPDFPKKLAQKLEKRVLDNALRNLPIESSLVDFSSNDYLGFSRERGIESRAKEILKSESFKNGATGSRLLSGNHSLYKNLEDQLSETFAVDSALVFNSGYDANIGFFSAVPQRGDIIFYDELVHASIRDGIKMSNAKAYKFGHNSMSDLKAKIQQSVRASSLSEVEVQSRTLDTNIYVVTESVFSMDGDSPNLKAFAELCKKNNAHLIVDEAHAVGVFGKGLISKYNLQHNIFAQIITFGKALGCHGAAILGSHQLKEYLVNFARSFIYTTALSPHSISVISAANELLASERGLQMISKLQEHITYFKSIIQEFKLENLFLPSDSAIQIAIVQGNDKAKKIAQYLGERGFDVRPILSPTVAAGNERLRICLHAFNTKKEIHKLLSILKETNG